MQCGCAGGFCSVLLVWNLLGGPHESGYMIYIYLLPQSSPLAQCSTATTCTIQTRLCSVPLWTEDLWGALWHVNLLFFFSVDPRGDWTPDLQRERQALYHWAIPPLQKWGDSKYQKCTSVKVCSVLLVWNLLGGPHESAFRVHLPASPVITASAM